MGSRATASSLASTWLSMRSIGLVSMATGAVDAANFSPRSRSIASIGVVSTSTGRSPRLRRIRSIERRIDDRAASLVDPRREILQRAGQRVQVGRRECLSIQLRADIGQRRIQFPGVRQKIGRPLDRGPQIVDLAGHIVRAARGRTSRPQRPRKASSKRDDRSCNVDVNAVEFEAAGARSSFELISLSAASSFAACGRKSACRSTVARTPSIRRAKSSNGLASKFGIGAGRRNASSRRAIWSCNATIKAFVSALSAEGRSSLELMSLRAASSFAACGRKSACRSTVARMASIRRAKSSIGRGSKFVDEADRRNSSSRRAVNCCNVDANAFELPPPATGGRSNLELMSLSAASNFAACGRKSACRSTVARTPSIRRAKSSIGRASNGVGDAGRRNASSRRAVKSCKRGRQRFRIERRRLRAVELRIDVVEGRFQLGGVRPLFGLPLDGKPHAFDAARQVLERAGIDRRRPLESIVHSRGELFEATFDRIQSRRGGRPLDLRTRIGKRLDDARGVGVRRRARSEAFDAIGELSDLSFQSLDRHRTQGRVGEHVAHFFRLAAKPLENLGTDGRARKRFHFAAQRANFPFEAFGRGSRIVVAERFSHLVEHGFDRGDEAIARARFPRSVQSLAEIADRAFQRDRRIARREGGEAAGHRREPCAEVFRVGGRGRSFALVPAKAFDPGDERRDFLPQGLFGSGDVRGFA